MARIAITGVGSELQGVGRLEDGRAAFVPGAIPGETVDIQITRDRGRFCEASLCAVLEPSPDRVAPGCPHAGICGGCQARHMRYERTLELKRRIVVDALTRIGGVEAPDVRDALASDPVDRARNKAEYPVARQGGRMVVGAFAHASRDIVPLNDCLLQSPGSVRALRWFAERLDGIRGADHFKFLVTRVNRAGEMMLILCADTPIQSEVERLAPALRSDLPELKSLWLCHLNRRPAHALDGRCVQIYGDEALSESMLGLEFSISPQSFFQVNRNQAERLYALALKAAGISPGCGKRALDAYCGTGTITLAAARWAEFATGVELVSPAISDAKANARRNGLSGKVRFICADAAAALPRLLKQGERFDAAILDPPRRGADAATLDALATAKIPAIAYVSCNPATLARDVKLLVGKGYRLEWAQPVDMFPWTGHVETVVLLSRQ